MHVNGNPPAAISNVMDRHNESVHRKARPMAAVQRVPMSTLWPPGALVSGNLRECADNRKSECRRRGLERYDRGRRFPADRLKGTCMRWRLGTLTGFN